MSYKTKLMPFGTPLVIPELHNLIDISQNFIELFNSVPYTWEYNYIKEITQ